jgi:hypothetical protein
MKDKWLLALGIAGWFLLYGIVLAPPLGETDTYFFKDAGANLALGHGFVSLATFGNPSFTPKLYAHYPPLHGLAYAAFSSLFGVGPRENALFNLTVAAVTTLFAYAALRRWDREDGSRLYRPALTLLTIAAVPMAFCGIAGDRPDAMGLAACIAAFLSLAEKRSLRQYFVASCLAGLALEISPINSVLAAAGIGVIWLSAWILPERRGERVALWRVAPVALSGALICPVIVTGTLLALDPTWLLRFLGVAGGSASPAAGNWGGGYFIALLTGHPARFFAAFEFRQLWHAVYYATLLAAWLAAIGYGTWHVVTQRSARGFILAFLVVAVGALPLLFFPYQSRYVGVAAGVVLILFSLVAPHELRLRKPGQLAIIAGFCGMVAVNAPFLARDLVYQAYLGPSLARMTATLARFKSHGVFNDKIVAVSPGVYMLFKEAGINVVNWYSPALLDPELRRKISFYAFTYDGTGDPLRPWYPDWWNEAHFKQIFAPQLPQQVRFFGLHSNSSITWEAAIYARRGAD